ncbi:MAG TPA: addiction module protein [Chthoniobacterales bacterium]
MLATAEIERMSVTERLQAIELLWTSVVASNATVSSPSWHQEVLSVRRAKVNSGEGRFLSISELRARLNQPRP